MATRGATSGLLTFAEPMMGGRVAVHVLAGYDPTRARRDAVRVLGRMRTWAGRLTRFEAGSDLMRLNADPRAIVPVGPTLAAVLDWARAAEAATDGIVDVTLLDARLAAESGTTPALPAPPQPSGAK
jgi:thiamine biosynthesis lipoprotein ApbE